MSREDTIGKLVDRLPYSDGGARRRFIAGAMLAIGIAAPYSSTSKLLGGLSLLGVLKTADLSRVSNPAFHTP